MKTENNINEVLTRFDNLVDCMDFVCKEHGAKCDPKITSDDLKALAAAFRKLQADNTALREGLEHYECKGNWRCEMCREGEHEHNAEVHHNRVWIYSDNGHDIARNTLAEVDKD